MRTEAVHAARKLFAAVEQRDPVALLAVYHVDVEIHEPAGLPYGGTYGGHEGALRHAQAYQATWEPYQSDPRLKLVDMEIEVADDDHVVVSWHQRARSPHAGTLDLPALSVLDLRDGKIIRSRMYQDTAEVRRFLAGSRSDPAPSTTLQVTRVDVRDPALFRAYAEQAVPLVAAHGGELVARSVSRPEVVEGSWPTGMVFLHSWPSKARFHEFYDSAAYQAARKLREGSGHSDLVVFDAVSPRSKSG